MFYVCHLVSFVLERLIFREWVTYLLDGFPRSLTFSPCYGKITQQTQTFGPGIHFTHTQTSKQTVSPVPKITSYWWGLQKLGLCLTRSMFSWKGKGWNITSDQSPDAKRWWLGGGVRQAKGLAGIGSVHRVPLETWHQFSYFYKQQILGPGRAIITQGGWAEGANWTTPMTFVCFVILEFIFL